MAEEKKKMSTGKKVLIGVGIYFGLGVIVGFVSCTKKKTANIAEDAAQTELAEMDAIYASHDPQVFLGYAQKAAEKQDCVVSVSVTPDVYTCTVETDIGGYVYSMSDDGADADGMVSVACLFGLDCSEEIFKADEHIEQVIFYFRVKDKLNNWLESAVALTINRAEFEKINYDDFRIQIQNDYNEIKKIAGLLIFGGGIEQRLKKYRR